jgi:hypothetical protein
MLPSEFGARERLPPPAVKGAKQRQGPERTPPSIANGVDKLYCQLVENHAIAAAQLVECAYLCCSDSTPSLVRARTDR